MEGKALHSIQKSPRLSYAPYAGKKCKIIVTHSIIIVR